MPRRTEGYQDRRIDTSHPTRLGLISDTHIPEATGHIPCCVSRAFENVDLILHAGDIYASSALDELERQAPVFAVAGDDDLAQTRADPRVAESREIQINGLTIWLTHLFSRAELRRRVLEPSIIVHGHSHSSSLGYIGRVTVVNPGSATIPALGERPSVAILAIGSGKFQIQFIRFCL